MPNSKYYYGEKVTINLDKCRKCGGKASVCYPNGIHMTQNYRRRIECSMCRTGTLWHPTLEDAAAIWNSAERWDKYGDKEGSCVIECTLPISTQQIIKAAVKAIEDINCEFVSTKTDPYWALFIKGEYCSHDRGTTVEVCSLCIVEHLIPHLEALKGLIDD